MAQVGNHLPLNGYMAANDPLLGEVDEWRSEKISTEHGVPVLYHADSSYFSMIGRLCLEEKGTPWHSRLVDIHYKSENLEPWYLAISPGACVPTLVTSSKVVPESLDIIRFVDANLPGVPLTPRTPEARQRMEDFIKLHYSFEIEDLTISYLMKTVLPMRIFKPDFAGTVPRLEAMKASHPEIQETIDRKIKQQKDRVKKLKNYEQLYDVTKPKVIHALDELEEALSSGGGPFICGTDYSLADVLFTCLLCRAVWSKPLVEEIEDRPHVQQYWDMVQSRPSFKSADMWLAMRPSKIGHLVASKLEQPCSYCCPMLLVITLVVLLLCGVIKF